MEKGDFAGQIPQRSIFPDDFGRESLGIIDFNHTGFNLDDFGRESLGIVNLNGLDLGRESLGITNIKTMDFFGLPQVVITEPRESSELSAALNNAFCLSSKDSIGSSVSSASSIFSLCNFGSLRSIPSPICTGSYTTKSDILNEGFRVSEEIVKDTMGLTVCLGEELKKDVLKETRRIKSAPEYLETKAAVESESPFDDVVFMEARYLSSSIADGSFFKLAPTETYILDTIQPPSNFVNISSEEPQSPNREIHPSNGEVQPFNGELQPSNGEIVNNIISSEENPTPANQSIASSSNDSKSKEAIEILHSLSQIISHEDYTEKQKSEGQILINSLVDLISNTGTGSSMEDSGHSSIEELVINEVQTVESYEVLDLRKKSSESDDNCVPLDLSMKSSKSVGSDKVFASPKILPPKFNLSQQKVSASLGNKTCGSNGSVSSNDSRNMSGKFKLKKVEEKKGKGPMKATVPLGSIPKKKNYPTPTLPPYKYKKTSTPIREYGLKPMAQSTPDTPPNTKQNTSLNTSLKLPKQKLNYSGSNSINKSQNQSPKIPKAIPKKNEITRRSFGDLRTSENTKNKLTRSYSMGESSALSSTLSRLKDNLNKDKAIGGSKTKLGDKVGVLKENRLRLSNGRSTSSRIGKVGKENVK